MNQNVLDRVFSPYTLTYNFFTRTDFLKSIRLFLERAADTILTVKAQSNREQKTRNLTGALFFFLQIFFSRLRVPR